MSNPDHFKTYLQTLQKSLSTGAATEHTYRPALQYLLEAVGEPTCFKSSMPRRYPPVAAPRR